MLAMEVIESVGCVCLSGFVRATLCTTSWVEDNAVHHWPALCTTDLHCAHGAKGGPDPWVCLGPLGQTHFWAKGLLFLFRIEEGGGVIVRRIEKRISNTYSWTVSYIIKYSKLWWVKPFVWLSNTIALSVPLWQSPNSIDKTLGEGQAPSLYIISHLVFVWLTSPPWIRLHPDQNPLEMIPTGYEIAIKWFISLNNLPLRKKNWLFHICLLFSCKLTHAAILLP